MDINLLNFEKFSGYGSKVSRKISITRSYSFGIPPAFYKDNNLEQFSYVIVYYDKVARVIALKFQKDDTEGGFKLVKYGNDGKRGASFVARSFFNTYGIDPKQYKGHYDAKKETRNDIGEIYWIALPEPSTETRAVV
jgi:hypothetical protein